MDRLTIIPSDGAVYTDDFVKIGLDLYFIPAGIAALQWKNGKGWLEFEDARNEPLSVLPDWAIEARTLAENTPDEPPIIPEN